MDEKRINTIETNQALMQKDISYIREAVDKMEKYLSSLDDRYASKTAERIIYGLVTVMLLGVVGALISLVLK